MLERVQNTLTSVIFSTIRLLSHRRIAVRLSLFCWYFHGKCWDELHFLVSPVEGYTFMKWHTVSTETILSHFHRLPFVKIKLFTMNCTSFPVDVSHNNINLTSSGQGSVQIYYPNDYHCDFLAHTLIIIVPISVSKLSRSRVFHSMCLSIKW